MPTAALLDPNASTPSGHHGHRKRKGHPPTSTMLSMSVLLTDPDTHNQFVTALTGMVNGGVRMGQAVQAELREALPALQQDPTAYRNLQNPHAFRLCNDLATLMVGLNLTAHPSRQRARQSIRSLSQRSPGTFGRHAACMRQKLMRLDAGEITPDMFTHSCGNWGPEPLNRIASRQVHLDIQHTPAVVH